MLLAREHKLGGGQGIGEKAPLVGDAPGIDTDEGKSEQDGKPHAHDIEDRHVQQLPGIPGQRQVPARQRRRAGDREQSETEGQQGRQRRCRDHHGGEEQERERVLEAAREEQEEGELDDVEGQKGRGPRRLHPLSRGITQAQGNVDESGNHDRSERGGERKGKAEQKMDREHGHKLAGDRHPAQADEGFQAQGAGGEDAVGGEHGWHPDRR